MQTKTTVNEDNPFGVLEFLHWNHEWNNFKYSTREDLNKAAKLMKEAGVGWVRLDFLWQDIEPSSGKFDYNKYDYLVDMLGKYNINILGILHYSTEWAWEPGCRQWNCAPSDNKLFVNYAVKVVERYKAKVKCWELWNEPDSMTYWKQQDGLKSYCLLLKQVYTAIKEVDPDCKVINGGLANGIASINHLYDNGAKDYFDALNVHIFENPLNRSAIKAVSAYVRTAYKIMSRNGDGAKSIWVTEIGCPGVKRGIRTKNWWAGNNPNEKQQAEWVQAVYNALLNDKAVAKVFWAFFRDTKEHFKSGTDYFGLIRWDFSKKPGFDKYKGFYREWKESNSAAK